MRLSDSGKNAFAWRMAVQHLGEVSGIRAEGDEEFQVHDLVDRDGGIFKQLRKVPLGSNWPVQAPGRPPPGPVGLDSPTEWSSLIGGLIQAWDQGHGSD